MGTIKLKWNNGSIVSSQNTIAQRASKRIKAIGGSYDTTGFVPANDMATTENETLATVINNRVYEFIIEAICQNGGPVENDNGPIEGIVFQCIAPTFNATHNQVSVVVNLLNTDISKIRVTLKRQLDDSTVGTFTASRGGDTATATFGSLSASTGYWVEIELYAVVNGTEVISSSANYLNAVCGSNAAPYQFTTSAPPTCPTPLNLEVVY